jgi:heme A synthase
MKNDSRRLLAGFSHLLGGIFLFCIVIFTAFVTSYNDLGENVFKVVGSVLFGFISLVFIAVGIRILFHSRNQ